MPFIGTQPDVGGYSVLDALTASATASYTLQKDSANFSPSSANQLLVSLNGVIQKPGSSFTVSGSTLTFSSALTSSDSIDFILAMGEPLLVGTPSDGTVSTAKIATDAVTGAKLANDIGISTTGNIATTSSGTLTSAGLITASSGVAVGGTGSANTLDDYEEGTWTPQLKISGATTGIVYGTQAGHYTKIGNRVIASAEILLSNKGSNTGNVSMIGLPFTTSNDNYQNASTYNDRVSSPNGDVQVFLLTNSTTASIYQSRTDGTNNGNLTGSEMNNDSYLVMFMTYKTG